MAKQLNRSYQFGPFCLDLTERMLLRNGLEIVLTPKTYEVLLALVENSGHIVERGTLMQRGWPNSFVEDANITQHISVLRRILSGENDNQQYIETIPKRGYRFTASVKEIAGEVEDLDSAIHSLPSRSEGFVPTHSDVFHANDRGQWVLVISATIKEIDKPIAEAIEAHLRKLAKDVSLTLLRIEDGSVRLILESTYPGFQRVSELVKSGRLNEVVGFDVQYLRWGLRSEKIKIRSGHREQAGQKDLSNRVDARLPARPSLALTATAFDSLLLFLDVDRERAAARYEKIRQRLIELFKNRGAEFPEELADTTIDLAARQIEQMKEFAQEGGYVENYFWAIGKKVSSALFYGRPLAASPISDGSAWQIEAKDSSWRRLEKCLLSLSVGQRELILAYYEYAGSPKSRKNLAAQMGIKPNVLRLRVHRIKRALKKCMEEASTEDQNDVQET